MKLFIVGLLLVGVALAHPVKEKNEKTGRTRRDIGEIGGGIVGNFVEPRYDFLPPSGEFLGHQYVSVKGHEYGAPPAPYTAPVELYPPPTHEEYGPPQESYGPPIVVTEHACPEEDIVPPFVPAPPAPLLMPLPEAPYVPVVYTAPETPFVEYGVPAEEYYVPSTEAITTTTEVPRVYYAPPPPPIPIVYAPYPAAVIETTTLPPVTLPPVVKTFPYPAEVKTGPYPAAVDVDTGNGAEAVGVIPVLPEVEPPFVPEVVVEPLKVYSKTVWTHPLKTKVHRFLRSLLSQHHK